MEDFRENRGNQTGDDTVAQNAPQHLNLFDLGRYSVQHHTQNNLPSILLEADEQNVAQASCPASPDYQAYIDAAARNIYDPRRLGDLNALEHKFDCNIHNAGDVFTYANSGLAVTGDRFNHALPPSEVRALQRAMDGGYAGIGLELDSAGGQGQNSDVATTVVKRPIPGRPAEAAGIIAGDAIVKVDNKDVHNLNSSDIAALITNGQAGSQVDLVVDRNGQRIERLITRQEIETPVVHDKDLGDGIAYIEVDNFGSGKTSSELAAAIDRHDDAKAFVVDIRNNPGGLVDEALQSAELFVPAGRLMTTTERLDSDPRAPLYVKKAYDLQNNGLTVGKQLSDGSALNADHYGRRPYKIAGRPVALLTNGESASASEIFTGALHDTAHDTVIGTTTYGKGIGQNFVKGMPDGGWLKVTGLHYLTPSGQWPGDADKNRIGLKADLNVTNPDGAKFLSPQDRQLNTAVSFLKDSLKK
ncbi:MAG: PDZ domain-containing protein [Cyanobacteria bacterium REEB67]|nr:PDZ domain-containing protein [Cyanobacteria bacterium REEB67]